MKDVVLLDRAVVIGSLMQIHTSSIQKVLEMIDLSNLRIDSQRLRIFGPRIVIMGNGIFDSVKHFGEEEETTDDQTSSTLSCLAMNCDDGLLKEVVNDELKLFVGELVAVVMAGKTVDNIIPFLNAALDEQKHIQANIKDCSDGANVMIFEFVLTQAEVWNL